MITIEHQFLNDDFYEPTWKINYLFLGTFNPSGTQKVNYYYGRKRNRTWELLSIIFCDDFDVSDKITFEPKIRSHGLACMDLIESIEAPKDRPDNILGKGFRDAEIINGFVKRLYNTKRILKVIESNPGVRIYSTWGKGSIYKECVEEISKIKNTVSLVSPSMTAPVSKGQKKFELMLADWKSKIHHDCQEKVI